MNNRFVAYDIAKVRSILQLSKVKNWYKSGVLSQPQFELIKAEFVTDLFHPTWIIKILLFIAAYFAISAMSGLWALLSLDSGEQGLRFMIFFGGGMLLFFTEMFILREKHYKSGVIEAGCYAAYGMIYTAILWSDAPLLAYYLLAFIFLTIISIRYLNLLTVVGALISLILVIFVLFSDYLAIVPILIGVVFTVIYFASNFLQKRLIDILWEEHFIIVDTVALFVIYLSMNYFVVRELSTAMMGLVLDEGQDIPYALFFYAFTICIPLLYLFIGIRTKSVLFLRVSLIVLALTVFTFKYYYSLGHPEITITLAGAFMITVALLLMNYLKEIRNGFTREQLLTTKWDNENMNAFVISQTLGGHAIKESSLKGQGGEFAGGGASGDF